MLTTWSEIDMETYKVLALRWIRQIGSEDGVEGRRFLACGFPGGTFLFTIAEIGEFPM